MSLGTDAVEGELMRYATPELKARTTVYDPSKNGSGIAPEDRLLKTIVGMTQGTKEELNLRTKILKQAIEIINRDRAATHGHAEDSFNTIGAYWSVYFSQKLGIEVKVSAMDVALLMDLFKTARIHNNPAHLDNWLDKAGYTALGGEIAIGN